MLRLLEPSVVLSEEIKAYREEFLRQGGSMDGCGSLRKYEDPRDWLAEVEALKKEETAPEGFVPMTQFLSIREEDQKLVGMIQIRHYLNEYLEKFGGHIGYSVRPGERRKGYATEMLRMVLPECAKLDVPRVLITCRQENEGSRRVILHNGGVYESTVHEPDRDVYLERYWIDLSKRNLKK